MDEKKVEEMIGTLTEFRDQQEALSVIGLQVDVAIASLKNLRGRMQGRGEGVPGCVANPEGDIWITPDSMVRSGVIEVTAEQAVVAFQHGWQRQGEAIGPDYRIRIWRA